MKRNSFIEMAKLHNLSGRITYISSHARQEHLYEVYATEPDRVFWRELAKCNQEEFEKSGTNGKCIEARELMCRTFRFADNEADGNLSFLEKEGYVHDGTASDEYTYNGLGFFWNPHEGGKLYCRDGTR